MKLLSEDDKKIVLQIGLKELNLLRSIVLEFGMQLSDGASYWREDKIGNRFLKVTKDCKVKEWVNNLSIHKKISK